MKVIIAGSRTIVDYLIVDYAISQAMHEWNIGIGDIKEIVSGKEPKGVDYQGEIWANEHKIPIKPFPANWVLYGDSAGPIRNTEMAKYADALIAIWDGKSRGTRDMINKANRRGLRVYIHNSRGR